jgi:hypothetical protein
MNGVFAPTAGAGRQVGTALVTGVEVEVAVWVEVGVPAPGVFVFVGVCVAVAVPAEQPTPRISSVWPFQVPPLAGFRA